MVRGHPVLNKIKATRVGVVYAERRHCAAVFRDEDCRENYKSRPGRNAMRIISA